MPARRDPRTRFEEDAKKHAGKAIKDIHGLRRLWVTNSRGTPDNWATIERKIQKAIESTRTIATELPPEQQLEFFDGPSRSDAALAELRGRVSQLAPAPDRAEPGTRGVTDPGADPEPRAREGIGQGSSGHEPVADVGSGEGAVTA